MHYDIVINYTTNPEKAGKLSVVDSSGNTVLDNIPVAVPLTSTILINNNNKLRSIEINYDSSLDKFDSVGSYKNKVQELKSKNRSNLIINAFNNVVFAGNVTVGIGSTHVSAEIPKLYSDHNSFVLHQKDFKKLSELVSKNNTFTVKTNKVSFLWFPEKVKTPATDINTEYQRLDTRKRSLEDSKKEALAKESAFKDKSPKGASITSPDYKIENTKVVSNPRNNTKSKRTSNNAYHHNDDLDAFDVVFMYNYPDLAPMYKPNSVLAWHMYFSDNELSKSTITNDVKSIPGFENVENADLKYTPSGYSIELYENEEKTRSLGTLQYNNQDKSYNLENPNGETTKLKVEDNGIINGSVSSTNNAETNFSFAEKNGEFVGNWNSVSSQGIEINSSVEVGQNYELSSNLDKSIDLNEVVRQESFNKTYNLEPEIEKEYTPPPPPPPVETHQWSSSNDPYGNSNSFSM